MLEVGFITNKLKRDMSIYTAFAAVSGFYLLIQFLFLHLFICRAVS